MYIAICDDQAEELNTITNILDVWQKKNHTALQYKTFRNASDLLDAAEKEHFTLYLLDVMMPGINGIQAAQEIRRFDEGADIIYLTSSPDFAYASYGVHALDYLLKPIQKEMLFSILDKLLRGEEDLSDCLSLKCGASFLRIPFRKLIYVEVMNKHLYFNLADGREHKIVGSLKDYESLLLSRPEFMRIHRSYIVNMLQVSEFSPAGVLTFSGKNLPVSRSLYPQLQQDYVKLLFEREAVK